MPWYKLECQPMTKRRWTIVILLVTFIVALVGPTFGPIPARWYIVIGRSMHPTIKWMTYWPYVSGYVHINPGLPITENSLIYFKVNGSFVNREIKRVQWRSVWGGQDCYWVTADNSGVTGEGSDFSDQYTWVKKSWVIGVVDQIWTPTRAWRARTAEGRLHNWKEFNWSPRSVVEGPDDQLAVNLVDHWVIMRGRQLAGVIPYPCKSALWEDDVLHVFRNDTDFPTMWRWNGSGIVLERAISNVLILRTPDVVGATGQSLNGDFVVSAKHSLRRIEVEMLPGFDCVKVAIVLRGRPQPIRLLKQGNKRVAVLPGPRQLVIVVAVPESWDMKDEMGIARVQVF